MLLLFVALLEEARPIIERYDLKKNGSIYTGANIKLIITGKGPFNACKMVERYGSKGAVFVNIGTCWSKDAAVGSLFVIGKIQMGEICEFPKFSFVVKDPIGCLETKLCEQKDDQTANLVDMEGFGFFQGALSFVNKEQILLIKIVSDNMRTPFDRTKVYELIQKSLTTIDHLIKKLQPQPFLDISPFLEKWHFTESEKNQLKDYLHAKNSCQEFEKVKNLSCPKKVLQLLKKKEILIL